MGSNPTLSVQRLDRTPIVDPEQTAELARRIAHEFQPERISLFGSYAYGSSTPDSEVDLLADPRFPIDLLARRPDDTARRYAEGDPLIREALDRGKLLYERDS